MFGDITLYAGAFLTVSYGALFAAGHRLRRAHWLLSLVWLVAASLGSYAVVALLAHHAPPLLPTLGVTVGVGLLVVAAFETWNPLGHLAFTATLGAAGTFLSYAVYILYAGHLGPWSLVLGVILLALQALALALLVSGTFENVDTICRTRWARVAHPAAEPGAFRPFVSLHIPIHNEPSDLVGETLAALAALDYDAFEVVVIDNNTTDEALWRPVEAQCAALGPRFRFFHLDPWPGYKSGALNFATAHADPATEIIGIVDADYVVDPSYLRELVGFFEDPAVAFVQTPQDYRDVDTRGRFARALYRSYEYFFAISMPSRNEYNGIIFAGTMGLIRRDALVEAGNWSEWCITEDAELSLRLLDRGYTSHFVAKTYGRGLMPLDYAGLKKQRYRWAFGGMQILRIHARRLFGVGNRGALTAAQRASYVNGGLQWLNDPLTFAFSALLLAGGAALLLGGSLFVQPVVGPVLLIPPLFIVLAVMRFAWALRVRTGCGWGEALDALTVLMGMTWVVTLACVRGLVSREGTFLRTPKTGDSPRLRDAVRVVSWETGVGLTCVALAAALVLSGPAVTFSARGLAVLLLVWQAVVYLSALRTSLWSYREGRGDARQLALLRSAGRSVGRFLSEPRLAIPLALGCALLGALYILSARQAPTVERIYRANPTGELLDVPSVLPPTVTEQAGAVLVQESEAARRQDVDAALALWASDGVLVDRNFTPGTAADDRRWTGLDEVRLRYEEEFRLRDYTSLRHLNITVRDLGDSLVVANDVDARIRDETGVRRVRLVQSDRWVLRRVGGAWRVVRLEINRAPAS